MVKFKLSVAGRFCSLNDKAAVMVRQAFQVKQCEFESHRLLILYFSSVLLIDSHRMIENHNENYLKIQ